MTAIMVAGRSGSAFAAQIGTMKLTEEVDAMRTIGVSPMEAIVLPRVAASTITMPLLGFYASLCAIAGGGLFCWVGLDIPPPTYIQRLRQIIPMTDFWIKIGRAHVELQSLMRISYAVFRLKKKTHKHTNYSSNKMKTT